MLRYRRRAIVGSEQPPNLNLHCGIARCVCSTIIRHLLDFLLPFFPKVKGALFLSFRPCGCFYIFLKYITYPCHGFCFASLLCQKPMYYPFYSLKPCEMRWKLSIDNSCLPFLDSDDGHRSSSFASSEQKVFIFRTCQLPQDFARMRCSKRLLGIFLDVF